MNDESATPTPAGETIVRVQPHAGGATEYDILIASGALNRLDSIASSAAPAPFYAIIADDRVATLHGPSAREVLRRAGRTELLTFAAGESSKTRETWSRLTDRLLELGLGRDGCVVALGGGVTCDLAGFVAATYQRGVRVLQIPTSMLAMVDASIGGKTGVDVAAGKNLVGAFHQPHAVVIDPAALRTLPDAQLRAGLAEAVKHGAIADRNHLERIGTDAGALLARDESALALLVRRSVEIKAEVVGADPFERGRRAILNFGHTIAHALERVTDYAVPHGFAVAIGAVVEARIGEAMAITDPGTTDLLRAVLRSLGLPLGPSAGLDPSAILEATRIDKKSRDAQVRYALIARPGEPARAPDGSWTLPVPDDVVLAALDETTV